MTKIWTVSFAELGEGPVVAPSAEVFLSEGEAWRAVALRTGGREDADVQLLRHWHAEHGVLVLDAQGNLTDPSPGPDAVLAIGVQEHYLP
jgi:hypothetical protein